MEVSESDSSSSQSPDVSSATQKIVNEIKTLEKELEEIQSSCIHSKYSLKNCPHGADKAFSLKKVCDSCQMEIGYPNPDEITKWVNS